MLPELHNFGKELSLVMNSGVQFVDFALNINWKEKEWREKSIGYFISPTNGPIRRLLLHKNGEVFFDPSNPSMFVNPQEEVSVEQSFKLYDGVWLPVPVLRTVPPDRFDEGPYNWARVRIVALEEGDDPDGNTHRITFAFDTKVFPNNPDTAYLAPTAEDVRAGGLFGLAHQSDQMSWFLDLHWVKEWLTELFRELAPEPARLKLYSDDMEDELARKMEQAHYLNVLSVLGTELELPNIKIVSNKSEDIVKSIPVDMVLDVGNSRTCGILVEDHVQEKDGLKKRYELELRDLTNPERVYSEPFESRVEFAQAFFGKDHWSVQSGRRDAFQWATIARVGKEAARLASRRNGNEGSTGLSSPKRYLWDLEKYEQMWRFNSAYVKTDHEPYATAEPLSGFINEFGEALHTLRDDHEDEFERKMPVFQPKYSRSSLMTFMLSEVLMQALMQINSPAQRAKLEHSRTPRFLRSIILTIPPAMPKPERDIFRNAMCQAVGLVWKSLGWDKSEYEDLDFTTKEGREKYWPILPEVHIQWDEATCSQVVYLFSETQNNYAGRPEEFIAAQHRPDRPDDKSVVIASVDIGGGTTDLVINKYSLDYGDNENTAGSNAYIQPVQLFRDGFKVAGDDILLDIIRQWVVKSLDFGLKQLGLADPSPILSQYIGSQSLTAQDRLRRQQLTLQIFSPIGLRILKEYENFDPFDTENKLFGATFRSLLSDVEEPTESVLEYINTPIARALGKEDFNILDLPIQINLAHIHQQFIKGSLDICKTFTALCEIINLYQCDVLLLTGRPSRLPGVQAFFRSRVPLPVGRILPLHHYRAGNWYPFHKEGRIDDPKTTAAVGAMLCFLSNNLRLHNFYFRAAAMRSYSTVKYIGLLDNNNVIKEANVYYSDVDLDNEDYELPSDIQFDVRGTMRLGFRQLNVERWVAAPMYVLTIENEKVKRNIAENGDVLKVELGVKNKRSRINNNSESAENFFIRNVESTGQGSVRKQDLKLQLNTMIDAGLGESQYWLDSGCVKL